MLGGNITAVVQIKSTDRNEIGELYTEWEDRYQLTGFLDLSTGDSTNTYYAKMQ